MVTGDGIRVGYYYWNGNMNGDGNGSGCNGFGYAVGVLWGSLISE